MHSLPLSFCQPISATRLVSCQTWISGKFECRNNTRDDYKTLRCVCFLKSGRIQRVCEPTSSYEVSSLVTSQDRRQRHVSQVCSQKNKKKPSRSFVSLCLTNSILYYLPKGQFRRLEASFDHRERFKLFDYTTNDEDPLYLAFDKTRPAESRNEPIMQSSKRCTRHAPALQVLVVAMEFSCRRQTWAGFCLRRL